MPSKETVSQGPTPSREDDNFGKMRAQIRQCLHFWNLERPAGCLCGDEAANGSVLDSLSGFLGREISKGWVTNCALDAASQDGRAEMADLHGETAGAERHRLKMLLLHLDSEDGAES